MATHIAHRKMNALRDAGVPTSYVCQRAQGTTPKKYQSMARTKCFQPIYGRYMFSLCSFNSLYGNLPQRNMRMMRRDTIMARDAWSYAGKNRHEHMNRVK